MIVVGNVVLAGNIWPVSVITCFEFSSSQRSHRWSVIELKELIVRLLITPWNGIVFCLCNLHDEFIDFFKALKHILFLKLINDLPLHDLYIALCSCFPARFPVRRAEHYDIIEIFQILIGCVDNHLILRVDRDPSTEIIRNQIFRRCSVIG